MDGVHVDDRFVGTEGIAKIFVGFEEFSLGLRVNLGRYGIVPV
jgi:hypothetical protein